MNQDWKTHKNSLTSNLNYAMKYVFEIKCKKLQSRNENISEKNLHID